jgi:multiple sugar transport system substrate-binding protein
MGGEVETGRLRRRDRPEFAVVALVVLVIIIAGGAIGSRYVPGAARSQAARSGASPSADPHVVRWFVGPGPRTLELLTAAQTFARKFNATNTDGTTLEIDRTAVTDSSAASMDLLKSLIAVGDAPDIIGPVTPGVLNGLSGLLLDLGPQIASNKVDLSVFDHHLLTLLQQPAATAASAQIGLPYAVDPSFIFYNKDLFKKAGLPDLPTKIGQQYMGQNWDWNALASVAARLTLDISGHVATDPDFDSAHISQFGIDFPGMDPRAIGSTFGSGSFMASDGWTIQIPSAWADGLSWYYNALWISHIAPPDSFGAGISVTFSAANAISSGRLAMAVSSASKMSTYTTVGNGAFSGWDMAVIPSWRGVTTSPEEVSTFSILSSSTRQDRAFSAMLALETDPDLSAASDGMPLQSSLKAVWLAAQGQKQAILFPGNHVDWSVLDTMSASAADPSQDSDLPNYSQTVIDMSFWLENVRSNPTISMKDELARLQQALQADATEVGPGPLQ